MHLNSLANFIPLLGTVTALPAVTLNHSDPTFVPDYPPDHSRDWPWAPVHHPKPYFWDPPSVPNCAPAPVSGYRDAHEASVRRIAWFGCYKFATKFTKSYGYHVSEYLATIGKENHVIWYTYFVEGISQDNQADIYHVDIRITDPDAQLYDTDFNWLEPVQGHTCEELLFRSWKTCYDNKGRGGDIQAGYLTYSIRPVY